MKSSFRHILAALAVLLTAGCADTPQPVPPADGTGQVWIGFAARWQVVGRVMPRTSLVSADNVQHVTSVHLYVFDGAGDDALCIASEDVHWQQPTGPTASQYYKLETELPDGDADDPYTFLAVGMDDVSPDTYGLPDAIAEGTTLTDAKAHVRQALVDDGAAHQAIATSELFAGSVTAAYSSEADLHLTIDLYRRVAGVLAYVTNIPVDVTDIELLLYEAQRAEVPLVAQPAGSDYGTEALDAADARTLLHLDVTSEALAAEQVTLADGTTYTKQPGSLLAGAYMLPMPAPADAAGHTLVLEMYKADGSLAGTKNVRLPDLDETGAPVYNFPLEANHFYTIGMKDATTDEPADLGGDTGDAVIYVDGNWQADVDIVM